MMGKRRAAGSWGVVVAAGLCACSGGGNFLGWGATGEHAQGSAKVGGDVVSTVDGVAIRVSEVQALVNASGLSPREALTRLQSEALLAGEAKRRGYHEHGEVTHVEREALVQSLLARVVEAERATEEEIAQAYAAQADRFHVPELRGSVHVLASLPENAAPELEARGRVLIQEAISALADAADPEPLFRTLGGRSTPELQVVVQRLPEVPREGRFVKEYADALFSAPGLGVLPEPVRTQFGWHAIYVTSIVPKKDVTLDAARATLRDELGLAKRQKRFEELAKGLRSETRVDVDANRDKKLAGLEL